MDVNLPVDAVRELVVRSLVGASVSAANAEAMAEVIAMAQADDCPSHGLYRVRGCIDAVRSGKVRPDSEPVIVSEDACVVRVDGASGFAPLALSVGRRPLIEAARRYGAGILAIRNCYHFSALWADIEPLVAQGLVVWAFTVGRHCVALADGRKPAMGANPMAFGFPLGEGRMPYIFDQSISAAARGEVELHARDGRPIPEGWALDGSGEPTRDARAALDGALKAFGGHKGAALGLMIELLAGPLIGDLTSAEALAADSGDGGPLRGGYLMIAIDPRRFAASGENLRSAHAFLRQLREDNPASRLPSERRYKAREASRRHGARVQQWIVDDLLPKG